MNKLFIYLLLAMLLATVRADAASERKATLQVSAVVLPAARIEVQSSTAVTVRVTMYPNVSVSVWTDTDTCNAPNNPKTISTPGIYQLIFTSAEVQGRNIFCLVSSDGILNLAVQRP